MGLFDFLRKANFFQGKDTAELKDEDLDFQKWIGAHRQWRQRLTGFIDGSNTEHLDENVVCHDNRCDLGKWIYSNGQKFYGDLPTFRQIVQDHAQFHRCAGQVIHSHKNEGPQAARKLLNSDFDYYSVKVIGGLETLERQIK